MWGSGRVGSACTTGIFPCYHAGMSDPVSLAALKSVRLGFCIQQPSTYMNLCHYIQMAFIPTMPEDMLATAKKVLGYTWYSKWNEPFRYM